MNSLYKFNIHKRIMKIIQQIFNYYHRQINNQTRKVPQKIVSWLVHDNRIKHDVVQRHLLSNLRLQYLTRLSILLSVSLKNIDIQNWSCPPYSLQHRIVTIK